MNTDHYLLSSGKRLMERIIHVSADRGQLSPRHISVGCAQHQAPALQRHGNHPITAQWVNHPITPHQEKLLTSVFIKLSPGHQNTSTMLKMFFPHCAEPAIQATHTEIRVQLLLTASRGFYLQCLFNYPPSLSEPGFESWSSWLFWHNVGPDREVTERKGTGSLEEGIREK